MAELALIDPSGRIAPTVQAILGRHHRIAVSSRVHAPVEADLVLLDVPRGGSIDAGELASLRSFGPLVVFVDRKQPVPSSITGDPRLQILRKPFEAFELRLVVERLLAEAEAGPAVAAGTLEGEESRSWLDFPFVPAPASAVLKHAATFATPIWIFGEPGCGRRRVARALCRRHHPPLDLSILLPSDSLEPAIERIVGDPGRVLLVYLIERRPLAEQERLAALLETESFGRLIAISTDDPAPAVLAGAFSADLYRRLIGLAVQLSPLRERPLAIPPLVQTFSRRLLRRLGWQIEVSYSPEAMAALQRYMWPGNLVELEAVVTRTLVTLGKETLASRPVEAGDLSFVVDFAAGVPPEAAPVPFVRSEPSQKESPESGGIEVEPSSEPLDGAVTELAHQLRNPLTVIRSFAAQAAGGGQAGDEDSKRMANLAEQACERIEGYLKEMSDFASFKEPRTEVLDLGALLAEAIGRCPTFDRSRIRLEGLSGVRVVADREQARFVLANVLAVALAEAAQAGTVELRMETERTLLVSVSRIAGPISMIRRLGEARGPLPSWRFLLARRVAARNGWRIDGQIDGDTLYIRCLLVVEEAGSGGQKTNRFDR